jgi:nucleotide-binding universal stress UspA family protein
VGGGAGSEVVVGLKRLGEPDPEVLDFAFGAADRQGLALRVVHTWRGTLPPSPHRLAPSDAPEEGERYASALADALRPWQVRHPDVAVRGTLLSGNASQALIGAAAHAALVVVGRGGRQTGHGRRVGAVVHALLHHCAVPVAVVPHT